MVLIVTQQDLITPVPETDVDVTASIFSVKESTKNMISTTNLMQKGWSHTGIGGASSKWTQEFERWCLEAIIMVKKELTMVLGHQAVNQQLFAGLFNGNQNVHYDGTDIIVADKTNSVKKIDTSDNSVTTILGPDSTNLRNVLDVTSDEDYYYTLAKGSSTYSSTTRICKWDRDDSQLVGSCSTAGRYGTALSIYEAADELFLLQTSSSSTYRKIVGFSTNDGLATNGKSISYGSGVSSYYYSQDIDVDENTVDVISYREFNGRMRAYDRATDGSYCASTACYTQVYTGARYAISMEVHDNNAYIMGFYYSSYYGGIKKMPTNSLNPVTT